MPLLNASPKSSLRARCSGNETFKDNVLSFPKPNNWNELSFPDKLKIYGQNINENYSLYSDKLKIKTYLRDLNIDGLNIVKLIKVLDKHDDKLDLSTLPKNCVIKTNHSWSDIIIIKDGKISKMYTRGIELDTKISNYKNWKSNALKVFNPPNEQHYQHIKPEIFVEEYLGDNLVDYKFFCFHGEVKFFQIDSDRFTKHCRNIYDGVNNNLLPCTLTFKNCKNITLPDNIDKMKEISESLSKQFEFVRVDLYDVNGKIYFGEFTFVHDSSNFNFEPLKYDKIIGKYWK